MYVLSPQHVMTAALVPRAHVKYLPADMEENAPAGGEDCPYIACVRCCRLHAVREDNKAHACSYTNCHTITLELPPQHSVLPCVVMPQQWSNPHAICKKKSFVGATACETWLQPQHATLFATLMAQQKHRPQLSDRYTPDGDPSSFAGFAPQHVMDPFARMPHVCCSAAATRRKGTWAGGLAWPW